MVTIRPLFTPKKKVSRRDYLIGFGCFLNPAPAEFLTITACSRNRCSAPAIFVSTPLNILILYRILAHHGAALSMQSRAGSKHGQGWGEPTQMTVLPTQSELDKDD